MTSTSITIDDLTTFTLSNAKLIMQHYSDDDFEIAKITNGVDSTKPRFIIVSKDMITDEFNNINMIPINFDNCWYDINTKTTMQNSPEYFIQLITSMDKIYPFSVNNTKIIKLIDDCCLSLD